MNNQEVKEIFDNFYKEVLIPALDKTNYKLDFFILYNYNKKQFKFIPVDEIKSYSRQVNECLLKNKNSFLVFASRDDLTQGTFRNFIGYTDLEKKVIQKEVYNICCQNYEILLNIKLRKFKNKEKINF